MGEIIGIFSGFLPSGYAPLWCPALCRKDLFFAGFDRQTRKTAVKPKMPFHFFSTKPLIFRRKSRVLVCPTGFEPATFGVGVLRPSPEVKDLCGFPALSHSKQSYSETAETIENTGLPPISGNSSQTVVNEQSDCAGEAGPWTRGTISYSTFPQASIGQSLENTSILRKKNTILTWEKASKSGIIRSPHLNKTRKDA